VLNSDSLLCCFTTGNDYVTKQWESLKMFYFSFSQCKFCTMSDSCSSRFVFFQCVRYRLHKLNVWS